MPHPSCTKVIVLGLDGLEPTIVAPMLATGELPNLATLRDRGGFARVATTAPAQTPVAWSSFATGTNPGGHGIFDFLRRDPRTCRPDVGLCRFEQKNAFVPPRAVSLRRGQAVWDVLTASGVSATVLRCPCTFAPGPIQGRMLAGMGVPDLRGGFGTATYYTTAEGVAQGEAEAVVRLRAEGPGTFAAELIGPRNPASRSDATLPLTIRFDPEGRRAVIRSSGSPAELEVREGRWSGWLKVKFKFGLLQTVRGQVRFYLASAGPEPSLYASPVNFDPEAPLFPISHPPEYAGQLAAEIGPFHTTGMVEDHAGLSNGRLDAAAFLAQCDDAWREREAMMRAELARFDAGLFFCLFDSPDRVQHMLWRHREPDHPANRRAPAEPELARAIEDQYRRADAAVGTALELADDRTLVIALSDHGFGSFRRGVHLNTWLHAHGLLALEEGVQPGEEAGDFFRHVDWGRTKAYALGLGGIYLNLKGREGRGTVEPAEADALKAEVARELRRLEDPGHGAPIRSVRPREELYSGPYAAEAPDLVVNFAAGYRASWASTLGGVPAGLVEDNVRPWAGDHAIDPALVPGVLFLNRPFRGDGARLVDLAPTILDALGVPRGPAMEGSSLLI